ncbi:thioesterase domain-containing protein [Klebsiella pneumoniae]|nr:thioesterase domain-containing protein [Klebsiella pneumoniae]
MLGALVQPALVDYRIQSPRSSQGPMASAASSSTRCASITSTLPAQQPHGPCHLFGYSLGGTLAQGLPRPLAPARRSGGLPRPADTWPPETQNWAEKEANGLDPEVLAEIDREREAFLAAQQGQASASCSAPSKATMPMRCGC